MEKKSLLGCWYLSVVVGFLGCWYLSVVVGGAICCFWWRSWLMCHGESVVAGTARNFCMSCGLNFCQIGTEVLGN